jgi:hypothetical protein
MLKLTIHSNQLWNDELEEFTYDVTVLELEHSLISLSKWESKFEKPFMGSEEKTTEETLGYIQAMCLTPDVPPEVFQTLNNEHFKQVNDYINAKMSATWFTELPSGAKGPVKREIITAEVLYYWIFSAQIDAQVVEAWHLNRLLTILKVFNEKNAPPKKMKQADAAAQRRALNAKRKAEHGTSG